MGVRFPLLPLMDDPLDVLAGSWYCGHYVGPAKWRQSGDWVLEPDECSGEGPFEISREEWNDLVFGVHCTECGAELFAGDGHFTLEDGTSDLDVSLNRREEKCPSSSKSEQPKAETTPSS